MEKSVGSLEIIFGPMFSGKSTRLRYLLTRDSDVGMNCLYITHSDDVRGLDQKTIRDKVSTTHHSSAGSLSDKITQVAVSNLKNINIDEFNVIGIDEGQFFDDLEKMVRRWLLKKVKQFI